jgi:antitoxin component YwqK of YwqJK toxin-antitoxin module
MLLINIINRIKTINQNIRFVGEFDENNLRNGYWEEYWDNGKILSKGTYLNGLRHGYWEFYYDNEILESEGNFIKGDRYGYWKFYDYYGKVSFDDNFIIIKNYSIVQL